MEVDQIQTYFGSFSIVNVLFNTRAHASPDGFVLQCILNVDFLSQLDYKVGWKKLKEVFSMAGVVVRTDILEDKDGKSRGMGTVTFEMPIEAVQAVCIL